MRLQTRCSLAVGLVVALALGGCAKKDDEAQKMAEMQKQLDAVKQELEAAKKAETTQAPPEQAAAKPGEKAPGKPASPAAKPGAPAGTKATAQMDKNSQEIAANRERIDANKRGVEENRKGVEENRKGVAENKQAAARAQATADEAKKAAIRPVHTLPAGYQIAVRTTNAISTKSSATGASWEGTLENDLEADGYIVAPKGSTVEGIVTKADDGGRVKGLASISVGLRRILTPEGRAIPIRTSSITETAKSSTKKDMLKTGIASGIGAAIGAIAGGGKGAAIGAGAGAAGGVGMAMATKGEAASIPAEKVLNFALSAAVTIEERKQR